MQRLLSKESVFREGFLSDAIRRCKGISQQDACIFYMAYFPDRGYSGIWDDRRGRADTVSGWASSTIASPIITTGNELEGEEIAEFSKKLNVQGLYLYAKTVKESSNLQILEENGKEIILRWNLQFAGTFFRINTPYLSLRDTKKRTFNKCFLCQWW